MKKRIIFIGIIIAVISIAAVFILVKLNKKDYKKQLQFTSVEKGNIKNAVSCTGTINAKGTVEVGTQVSGTISKVFVNYNDNVKKDQILAKIDTTLLTIAVQAAEADLLKATSQYNLSLKEYENNLVLYENKLISSFELDTFKVAKEAAYAQKLSSESNLKKAKANLQYTIIRSPINGTVIDKNVEEGQTVAASLSAPTLFVIADNLSNMEIHALVDESDIGKIKINQKASFTVESYSGEEFHGVVREIRLQPTTVSNVVNYTVIIDAPNDKKLLLPGMTATIDIVTEEKNDILLISNNAVKFKPTEAMLAEFKKNMEKKFKSRHENNTNAGGNDKSKSKNFITRKPNDKDMKQLWFLDKDNNLNVMPIKTGMSDSQNTEIIENPKIKEGMKFISGITEINTKTKTENNKNSSRRGFRPPMM